MVHFMTPHAPPLKLHTFTTSPIMNAICGAQLTHLQTYKNKGNRYNQTLLNSPPNLFLNSFKPVFCVALCNAIWKSSAKTWRKSIFLSFIYYIFSSYSNFTLKSCVVLCNAPEKSQAKIEENSAMKFLLVQTFLTYAPRNLWDAHRSQQGWKGKASR